MTVSVVMCTHNGATRLLEQLESIATQVCPSDELVICNDRPTNRTTDIVRAFTAVAPFEVHFSVNQERVGSTANFEWAVPCALGRHHHPCQSRRHGVVSF